MPLIFRDTKGAPLTSAEGDANIRRLDAGKDVVDAAAPIPLTRIFNRLAGYAASFIIATSGSKRWQFGSTGDAESGANAGSNFFIDSLADDGTTVIARSFSIERKTGIISLSTRPVFSGNAAWDAGNFDPTQYVGLAGAQTISGIKIFSSAPNYSNTTVARAALANIQSGRSLVSGTRLRIDFTAATITTVGFTKNYASTDYDGTTFAAPVAGLYRVACAVTLGNAPGGNFTLGALNPVGGAAYSRTTFVAPAINQTVSFEAVFPLAAGQQLQFYVLSANASFLIADATYNQMQIEQLA